MSGVSEYCWEKVVGDIGDSGLGIGTVSVVTGLLVLMVVLVVAVTVAVVLNPVGTSCVWWCCCG